MGKKAVLRNISRSIDAINREDYEDALKQISHAIDSSAKRKFPELQGPRTVGKRIKQFIKKYEGFILYFTTGCALKSSAETPILWNVKGKDLSISEAYYDLIRNPIAGHGDDYEDYIVFSKGCAMGQQDDKFLVSDMFIACIILICISDPINKHGKFAKPLQFSLPVRGRAIPIQLNEYWGCYEKLAKITGFTDGE